MSYLVHSDIVDSGAIRQRCSAAAALEGQDAPQSWVNASMWNIPNPDWTDAWAAAEAASPGADHGSDESVVTDPMILQGVQKERSRENPQPWSQPSGGHDAYPQYVYVTHDGGTWQSTADGNVWEPGVSGWTQVS